MSIGESRHLSWQRLSALQKVKSSAMRLADMNSSATNSDSNHARRHQADEKEFEHFAMYQITILRSNHVAVCIYGFTKHDKTKSSARDSPGNSFDGPFKIPHPPSRNQDQLKKSPLPLQQGSWRKSKTCKRECLSYRNTTSLTPLQRE